MIKLIIVFIIVSVLLDIISILVVIQRSRETRWHKFSESKPWLSGELYICEVPGKHYLIARWEGQSFIFLDKIQPPRTKVIRWKLVKV